MNPTLKNILAVIAGVVAGWVVNMGLVMISPSIIPTPGEIDTTDLESMKASIHLFELKHFIFPFLAHALGTLAGAFLVARLAVNNEMKFALGIGVFFLLGGIAAATMIPAPTWFIVLDLVIAYLPMAWLGGKLGMKKQSF